MANTIVVSSGYTLVNNGGVETLYDATNTSVGSYTPTASDVISVLSGGTATDISVGAGGEIFVYSGASVSGLIVSSGGLLDEVQSGTSLSTPAVVHSGAEVEFAYLNASGQTSATATTFQSSFVGGVETITATRGNRSMSVTVSGDPSFTYTTIGAGLGAKSGLTFTAGSVCYKGGTEILAERGPMPVEAIKAGDKVVVRRDGKETLEPVTWVGSSSIDLGRHAKPETAAPVRIKAGALADHVPARDLLVSPEHCMIVGGKCVPAKLLVNGGSITRDYPAGKFEYYHIELEKHGILVAEGAEAESYLDTGNRSWFDNADEPRMLHPEFEVKPDAERWQTEACAPLATDMQDVGTIWQSLADRAVALGYTIPEAPAAVTGADIHLMVDGKRINPASDANASYVFAVPAGAQSVTLASRHFVPADRMIASVRDSRSLGVRVSSITVRSSAAEIVLSADHPALRDGWYEAEKQGFDVWRWTDGAATLPWDGVTDAAILTVNCRPSDWYPVEQTRVRAAA